MPKKITERIVTGQRGVNLVESIILEMGFAFHQTGAMEAGIDGIIEIRDPVTEEVKNLILQMQSKATLGRFTGETETTFHFTCEEDDLGYWMTGNVPVIFVRSRPSTGEAYWVPIKDYFKDVARRRSRRIDFDKVKDRFTPECADALAKLATRNVPGLVFARPHVIETLYSNLLRVTEFAPNLHIAKTTLRDRADVWKIVSADGRASGEWVLNGGYLYSFVDLGDPPWSEVVDVGTIERHTRARLSDSTDKKEIAIFIELLRRCLREKTKVDLGYDLGTETFFFKASPDLSPVEFSYPGIAVASSRFVFKGYGHRRDAPDHPSYFRHSAFTCQFKRFGAQWYLEVTPTYRFTTDGYRLHPFQENLQKGIKRLERNAALLGQLVMWRYLLTRADLLIKDYKPLRFSDFESFAAGTGLRDEQWVAGEEQGNRDEDGDDEALDANLAANLDVEEV